MGLRNDKFVIIIAAGFVLFLWFIELKMNFWLSAITSLCFVFAIFIAIKGFSSKDEIGLIKPKEFLFKTLLYGTVTIKPFLLRFYGIEEQDFHNDYILLKDKIVYFAIKSTPSSTDDVIKAFRIARKENVSQMEIIYTTIIRKALSVLSYEEITVSLTSFYSLYRNLRKKGLLPLAEKKKKPHFPAEYVKNYVFNASNIKLFLYSAFITLFAALFTPFRLYYLVFASINVLLAFITLAISIKRRIRKNDEKSN